MNMEDYVLPHAHFSFLYCTHKEQNWRLYLLAIAKYFNETEKYQNPFYYRVNNFQLPVFYKFQLKVHDMF